MTSTRVEWTIVESEMFAENAYIVLLAEQARCFVVDPGSDTGRIIQAVESLGVTPEAIVNTHGHADHMIGNGACKDRWPDAPIIIGHGDAEKLINPGLNLSANYGLPITSPPADKTVAEGDTLELAGMNWEVYEAPGHSCGHVVFVNRQQSPFVVLGGDVLFRGSVGRSDFPDGSHEQLIQSIQDKLLTLPDDTIVLPGHGPATTVGEERRSNPFL